MTRTYSSKFVGFVGALLFVLHPPSAGAAAPAEAAPDTATAATAATESTDASPDEAEGEALAADPEGPAPAEGDDPEASDEGAPDEPPENPSENASDDPPGDPAETSESAETAETAETAEASDPGESPDVVKRGLPRHRLIYNQLIGARYNPLGLSSELNIGYRYQLINKDTVLFRDSFIAAQAHAIATPAFVGGGPRIDIQPAAVLNLSATYDYIGFFGGFGSLQSFPSANAEHHDDLISDLADMGLNYGAGGHQITLAALVQGKVKHIAIRDNPKFYWFDFDLRSGDKTFYNQTIDLLVPDRGWAMTNDLDLLYLFDFGLTLGARYTVSQAFYRDEHFAPGEEKVNLNGPTHRVGPALIYTFFNRPDQRFNQPSLVLLAQWWAKHRYRTGQQVSQAVPYFVLAFTFKGTILPHPASWNPKSEKKKRRKKR